jgi:hypothetical protein
MGINAEGSVIESQERRLLVGSDNKLTYSPHEIFGEIPNLILTHHTKGAQAMEAGAGTYVLEGLISSTRR